MKLVIVESPTKARTISRFLSSDFKVESSYGHIRDLPKSKLGVDVENDFAPTYIIPTKARKNVNHLKKEVEKAKEVILATDEDREGEAIAWHLVQALGLNDSDQRPATSYQPEASSQKPEARVSRIVFHEITKSAIEEAIQNPRSIDMRRVGAQQARRILDRLVGYELSPFLWKKVRRGLSAGRVQSVAVRLICEREKEIQDFKPQEYWTIKAIFKKGLPDPQAGEQEFQADLIKIKSKALDKLGIKNKKEADKIVKDLTGKPFAVTDIEEKRQVRKSPPPFTTSTLQQEAFRKLRFSAKMTMVIAQQLYEGIDSGDGPVGLITYMRTDSLNLSQESLRAAKSALVSLYGENYSQASPRYYKTKAKGAQEAHEAIRPTDPARTPKGIEKYLDKRQFKLYDLIWRRFMASQMPDAQFDTTTAHIESDNQYLFRARGIKEVFDGFTRVWPVAIEEITLPELKRGEKIDCKKIKPEQHFTEPPPRYTEASLVKLLEENGIGRPSTYAPIMSTIQDRHYVEKDEHRRFKPTETGVVVNELLVEHFPEIVDIDFTRRMEEDLDKIAEGEIGTLPVLKEFYEPFSKNLIEKHETVEKKEMDISTNEVCEKCGKPMVIRWGRFGKFMACSGFPECKNAKNLKENTLGIKCPLCKEGDAITRKTKRGRIFYGCSKYPQCTFATWQKPNGELCRECGKPMIHPNIKSDTIMCSNKECPTHSTK